MFSSLNEKLAYEERDRHFHCFSSLPWELRNAIWKASLETRRLIRVGFLQNHAGDEEHGGEFTQAQVDDDKTGLYVKVDGPSVASPLLLVSREARQAALEFYRVSIPCYLTKERIDGSLRKSFGIFIINPEYDILSFEEVRGRLHSSKCFSALVDLDPRHVGVQNLGISLSASVGWAQSDTSDFLRNFSHFREIYFTIETNRQDLKIARERYYEVDLQCTDASLPNIPIQQHFSPLNPCHNVSFDILRRDPRPIKNDLSRVFVGHDDISMGLVYCKKDLVDEYWGAVGSAVEYRVLFLFHDRNNHRPHYFAEDWETDIVSEDENNPTIQVTQAQEQDMETGENMAFGFWIFPLDAFTEATRIEAPVSPFCLWDLSDSTPELGLVQSRPSGG